ncbi:hypothetical protein [Piscirickettsia litoralis]|uniref:Uncharacterized protein n=1 Tax=Piscirickettsia litoralis TaxID=1891921 RepID=A0ABX2ZYU4_9GAMM|nr:hypothetical protein [Piscirickettsia litoralis]ODN41787.1 hypothetical protein BGC07_00820 [Piscirickettsia litoralis]
MTRAISSNNLFCGFRTALYIAIKTADLTENEELKAKILSIYNSNAEAISWSALNDITDTEEPLEYPKPVIRAFIEHWAEFQSEKIVHNLLVQKHSLEDAIEASVKYSDSSTENIETKRQAARTHKKEFVGNSVKTNAEALYAAQYRIHADSNMKFYKNRIANKIRSFATKWWGDLGTTDELKEFIKKCSFRK